MWLRLIAKKLQGTLVGFSRLVELIFNFLYISQIVGRQTSGEDIDALQAKSYGFHIGLTGGGTVALQAVSKPQRPVSSSARRQVSRVEVLPSSVKSSWV